MKIKRISPVIISAIFSLSFVSCTSVNFQSQPPVKVSDKHTVAVTRNQGAAIKVSLNFNEGNFGIKAFPVANSRIQDIRSYKVTLCTDSDSPLGTDISFAGVINVDRDGSVLSSPHTVTFTGVPEGGPYYAVVSAFDGINGTGNNITAGTFYDGEGTEIKVSVSANSATVDSNYQLIFSNAPATALEVNLKLQPSLPGNQDFQIDNGGGFGSAAQNYPSVDTNALGNGLAVFTDYRGNPGIYARHLRHFVPVSSDFLISDDMISSKAYPHISLNSSGDGLVVWHDSRDGSNHNIYARKILNYQASGSDFRIANDTTSNKTNAKISLNENGDGVVVWSDFRSGSAYNIYMRQITGFAPIGSDMQLSGDTLDQLNASISNINASGQATVVWENNRFNGSYSIVMKNINNFAPATPSAVQVDSDTGNTTSQKKAAVYADLNGNGIIVWVDGRDTDSLHYRPLQNYGLIGTDQLLANPSGIAMTEIPSIQLNSKGDGLVVFNGASNQVHAQRINNYNGVGDYFRIDDGSATAAKSGTAIRLNNRGNGIVVWEDGRNSPSDIFARHIVEFDPF